MKSSTRLQDASVLHFDETGTNVDIKTHCLHIVSIEEAPYITVHPKRGKDGTDDNGVLGQDLAAQRFMIVGRHILSMKTAPMLFVVRICFGNCRVLLKIRGRIGRF